MKKPKIKLHDLFRFTIGCIASLQLTHSLTAQDSLLSRVPLPMGGTVPYQMNKSAYPSSTSTMATPTLSNSISNDYVVGSGDVLLVVIFSQTYTSFQLPVTPSGTIIIPRLREISVRDMMIGEVQKKLNEEFSRVYRSAEVSVTLLSLRSFYVDVVGEVSVPTRLLVNAATRLSDVISQSPVLQNASLRQVKIKRLNPDTLITLDVFRYYRLLDNRDNPYLKENDIIEVSKQVQSVSITGEVKYPNVYEFIKGDSLYTLFKLAGGIIESAILDSVEIIRFTENQLSTISINVDVRGYPPTSNLLLQDGDRVQVRRIPFWRPSETVQIEGRVKIPGIYRIEKGKTTVMALISMAGGFIENASLEEATIVRPKSIRKQPVLKPLKGNDFEDAEIQYYLAREREEPKGKMVVDFKKLFLQNDLTQNILLEEGDVITIPYLRNYVNVIGKVKFPGNIAYKKGATLEYYITKAGGFGRMAKEHEILILKPNTGDLIDIDDVEAIEPSDVILVQEREKSRFWTTSWEIFRDTIGVVGAVATTILLIRNLSQ